ncbi:MAG: hypothetical protein ACI8RD_001075, partial [Bacillariaceae sp.]|jgi:hypothetical protein
VLLVVVAEGLLTEIAYAMDDIITMQYSRQQTTQNNKSENIHNEDLLLYASLISNKDIQIKYHRSYFTSRLD